MATAKCSSLSRKLNLHPCSRFPMLLARLGRCVSSINFLHARMHQRATQGFANASGDLGRHTRIYTHAYGGWTSRAIHGIIVCTLYITTDRSMCHAYDASIPFAGTTWWTCCFLPWRISRRLSPHHHNHGYLHAGGPVNKWYILLAYTARQDFSSPFFNSDNEHGRLNFATYIVWCV